MSDGVMNYSNGNDQVIHIGFKIKQFMRNY